MDISVIVPVYGCPEALPSLHERLINTLEKITDSFELIFVNDCCPKGSWKEIEKICEADERVVGVDLSRNFGQIHATNAGIDMSKGEYVVLMDCDLQDRPEGISDLFNEIQKGYDIVFAKRKERKDSKITLFLSGLFYKVYNYFVDGYYDPEVGNFSIARRKIVDEYIAIKDTNKSFTSVLSWMGYRTSYIEIEGEERFEGKSSYTLSKKIDLAFDMLTSQSDKPLKAIIKLGFLIAILAFIYLITQVILYFIIDDIVEGWTSLVASVFLMGGILLICLGAVGIYVGNIFSYSKGFPGYLIKEVRNSNKE